MVHSVRGFRQPTHYEGVVKCMVRVPELPQRAPMWTAASWKTNGREKGGLVNQDISLFFMDSFRPPPCLYRSQPPPDQSSCPSAAHNCMIYLLSLIHSSFSLPLFWQISTVSFKPHLRKHPVPSASARYFLVYSRPRCKPIRSLKEIPNLCKYPSPVIAEVKSTTERERNTRRFFSGTENRKALRYNTALKGKETIAAVNGVVSLYEPYCSVMIDR